MPMTEKEYNSNLLDQITLLERLEIEAQKDNAQNVLRQIAFEKRQFVVSFIKSRH